MEIYFKGLAHSVMEPSMSKICEPVGDQGRVMLQFKSKVPLLTEFLLVPGMSLFILFWPSIGCIKPSHTMKGNLLYSKSTDLTVNII